MERAEKGEEALERTLTAEKLNRRPRGCLRGMLETRGDQRRTRFWLQSPEKHNASMTIEFPYAFEFLFCVTQAPTHEAFPRQANSPPFPFSVTSGSSLSRIVRYPEAL